VISVVHCGNVYLVVGVCNEVMYRHVVVLYFQRHRHCARDATGCIETGSTAWMTITRVETIHHSFEKVVDMVSQYCSLINSGDAYEIQHHLKVPTLILTYSRRRLQVEDKSDQKTSILCILTI
jgi:hypothetical protein